MWHVRGAQRPHVFVLVGVLTLFALFLVARALGQSASPAAVAGKASTMVSKRTDHTGTLLTDGRVLVVGGDNGEVGLRSAEIYDPETDTWSAAGDMSISRIDHTATLLTDGRVLVTGGRGSRTAQGKLDAVELYDPATGTFSVTASLSLPRSDHTATLLTDGRVLVTGGDTWSYVSPPQRTSAEIYNPATGTWQPASPMTTLRRLYSVVPLSDGRALAVGDGYDAPNSAEIYDSADDRWRRIVGMQHERAGPLATRLGDGRVLVVDGAGRSDYRFTTAELYDPQAGTWRLTGGLYGAARQSYEVTNLTLSQLADGSALLFQSGFFSGYGGPSVAAQIYDVESSRWFPATAPEVGGYAKTVTPLRDGSVLLSGGFGSTIFSYEVSNQSLRYTPAALRNQQYLPIVGAPFPPFQPFVTPTTYVPVSVTPIFTRPTSTAQPIGE